VARVWSAGSELLAIDRDCEYRNSVTAAEAGAGAPVIDYRPGDGILVIGYIDGVTFTNEDVAKPGNLTRIADAVRTLHAGGRFGNDFNMFEIQARYAGVTADAGMRIPDGYHGLRPQFEAMRAALAVRDEGTVPCNNDLLAANFIDDGQKIWLIDYEYAGNNDACFELGNIWSESNLSPAQLDELVTHYYGRRLRHKIARARLLGLMSKYGWTLWASIQDGVSDIDFDFWEWGLEKYDRAVLEFDGPDFGRLLDDVTADD
jgi:thiamine kinase-like enzyme